MSGQFVGDEEAALLEQRALFEDILAILDALASSYKHASEKVMQSPPGLHKAVFLREVAELGYTLELLRIKARSVLDA